MKTPDGNVYTIGDGLFRSPEIIFDPSAISRKQYNFSDSVYNSIMKCDKSIHDSLFNNIYLTGGTSMFPGISQRLQNDLEIYSNKKITIYNSSNADQIPWERCFQNVFRITIKSIH